MEKGSIMIVATCIVSFAYLASGIPGTASFFYPEEMDYMDPMCDYTPTTYVAAMGAEFGFDETECGRLYSVRCTGPNGGAYPCTGKNVMVMVVLLTKSCLALELQKEAFNIIANHKMTHIIKIDYELI